MDTDEPLAHSLSDYLLDVADQLDVHAARLRVFAAGLRRSRLTAEAIAEAEKLAHAAHDGEGHLEVARRALPRLLAPLVADLPWWVRVRVAWAVLFAPTAARGARGGPSRSRPAARPADDHTPPEPRCTRP